MRTPTASVRAFALRSTSDAHVFERAFTGDAIAFAEVYRRYRSRVYGFCLARLLSAHDAEDAMNEVFERALTADHRAVETPSAWLFGIARYVCIDVERAHNRAGASNLDDSAPMAAAGSVEESVVARDEAKTALVALRRLAPRYRTALVMRGLLGESSAALAESLDMTPGATHTLVSRARAAFGREFAALRNLPASCRDSVTLMYKRDSIGLDDAETGRLDIHLATCASCARESKRLERGDRLHALLPLLPTPALGRMTPLEAAIHLAAAPEFASSVNLLPTLGKFAAAAALAAAAIVSAPQVAQLAGTIWSDPPPSPTASGTSANVLLDPIPRGPHGASLTSGPRPIGGAGLGISETSQARIRAMYGSGGTVSGSGGAKGAGGTARNGGGTSEAGSGKSSSAKSGSTGGSGTKTGTGGGSASGTTGSKGSGDTANPGTGGGSGSSGPSSGKKKAGGTGALVE